MALPLRPLPVKYSALAKNETGLGVSACTMTESKKDRWLGATMKGPSTGTFARPSTVGLHSVAMVPRVNTRVMSYSAMVALPRAQGQFACQLLR